MASTATETALCLHVDQIVHEGPRVEARLKPGTKCDYCGKEAGWMLGTGADPELLPHCDEHAAEMIRFAASVIESMSP